MADLPAIRYAPHFAFIGHFDHSESIRIHNPEREGDKTLVKIASQFSKDCVQLRKELVEAQQSIGPTTGAQRHSFASHLFRPLCYAALGHTDDLGIALLDNLPLVIRMTALNRAIEKADVAFCPLVETFCPTAGKVGDDASPWEKKLQHVAQATENKYWPFRDLHTLINDDPSFAADADWTSITAVPPALRDTPLCVIANFKLSTFATLGHAALLQQAVMGAVVETVRRTCLAFLDESGTRVRPYAEKLIQPDDLLKLKCVLLESQSAEDLVLLVFCSSYTPPEMLITALRNMTFADLLTPADPPRDCIFDQVKRALARTLADSQLGEVHQKMAGGDKSLKQIHGNHLFMASYSTLAVQQHILRVADPQASGVHGFVEANVMIRVKPGHERQIRQRLDKAHEGVFGMGSGVQVSPADLTAVSIRILPGLLDQVINLAADKFPDRAMVRTADVFRFLHRFFSGQDANLEPGNETGFLKLATSLVVPIPKVDKSGAAGIAADLPNGEFMPHGSAHPVHGAQFFRGLLGAVERKQFGHEAGDTGQQLRDALRKVGCPPSLQYSLVYLFQEFFSCLDDPPRCVAVLDLYECFAALDTLIRKDCPKHLDAHKEDPIFQRREQARLFEESLRPFVDALQNSFTLRLERAIPRHEVRDTAFNFRGGVSKFVAAMDVPLKCSLGLYRRMCQVAGRVHQPEFKQRFAGVTSIGIGQQTTARLFHFGSSVLNPAPTDPNDFQLCFVTFHMDVMRLYGPEQIVHFLHEFGHLYFNTFISRSAIDFRERFMAPAATGDAIYERMRTAEVFAELVTQLFVFGEDTDLFSKFYALTFSEVQEEVFQEDPADQRPLASRRADALIEAAYRAFLVVDFIKQRGAPEAGAPQGLDGDWDRFKAYVLTYGPYYRDYSRLWEGSPSVGDWEDRRNWFEQEYHAPETVQRLARVRHHANLVYRRYTESLSADPFYRLPVDAEAFRNEIDKAVDDGRAFRSAQYSDQATPDAAKSIDPLPIICRIAYKYIKDVYGEVSADKVIFVESEVGTRTDGPPNYNTFLFAPGHVPLYCVDPVARGKRLLSQVACFKTLWDISSQLRARRLLDMIHLNDKPVDPEVP